MLSLRPTYRAAHCATRTTIEIMPSHDTRTINADRSDIEALDEIWLFGYGSLIYKVDFPYAESATAHITGWQRRFWQGSHDHRGTPEQPGRVLTLIEVPNARCFGIAYRVTLDVFDHLDHREKNGYLRSIQTLYFGNGEFKQGVVYIGKPDNPAFLGEAPIEAIAQQISKSVGPSGPNTEYVHRLADALRQQGEEDEHVFEIDRLLREMR